jgi:hypothetical protein
MQLDESQPSTIRQEAFPASARARRLSRFFWFLETLLWGSLLASCTALLLEHVIQVSQGPTDFCQDYTAIQRLLHGDPIYTPIHCWASYVVLPTPLEYHPHPPTSVLLLAPFGLLPRIPATLLWGLCLFAAYAITGVLLLKELGWCSLRGLAIFAVGSALWEPATVSETVQNFQELLTLLIVGAWLLERKGHQGWAGGLLGLAGLLKLWPAGLLLGALIFRQKRAALVGLLTLSLGVLLTFLLISPQDLIAYLGPVQANEGLWVASGVNVSLVSAVVRPLMGYHDGAYIIPALLSGLSLSTALLLGEMLAALLVIVTVGYLWWRNRSSEDETIQMLSQGVLVTVLLLAFPITWRWGMITLLFPCATTLLALRHLPRQTRRVQALLWVGLVPLLLRQSWVVAVANLLQPHSAAGEILWFTLPTLGLLLFTVMQFSLLWQASTQKSA